MQNYTLKLLQDVRTLLTDENHWCQGVSAATADDQSCNPTYEKACQWCMTGAIDKFGYVRNYHVLPEHLLAARRDARDVISKILVDMGKVHFITIFNDDDRTTHEDVLLVLDAAINRVEKYENL